MNILDSAFAFGEIDNLKRYLRKDCEYISECANKQITSSEEIIRWMVGVSSCLWLKDSYTFKLLKYEELSFEKCD